ncbi:MAG TPA: hypothetical protein VMU83_18190 [Hanamia sp.]|nr:hypothetical protein [Hanamia sp.]
MKNNHGFTNHVGDFVAATRKDLIVGLIETGAIRLSQTIERENKNTGKSKNFVPS